MSKLQFLKWPYEIYWLFMLKFPSLQLGTEIMLVSTVNFLHLANCAGGLKVIHEGGFLQMSVWVSEYFPQINIHQSFSSTQVLISTCVRPGQALPRWREQSSPPWAQPLVRNCRLHPYVVNNWHLGSQVQHWMALYPKAETLMCPWDSHRPYYMCIVLPQ